MNQLENKYNGWLVVDKEIGMTSRYVVNVICKTLKQKKVGHAGTLDPFATGVLAIAVGKATKTISHIMPGLKKYEFVIKWGKSTDSHDLDGKITSISKKKPNLQEIRDILESFKGEIMQIPPKFSAIKVNGKRAYNLAREGKEFEIKPRKVYLKSIKLLNDKKNIKTCNKFEIVCGKGFYVRSLVRDICSKLSVDGHTTSLKRLESLPFTLDNAITLDKFLQLYKKNDWKKLFLPIYSVLNKIKYVGKE